MLRFRREAQVLASLNQPHIRLQESVAEDVSGLGSARRFRSAQRLAWVSGLLLATMVRGQRFIAINPVNPSPHKTRFHELAHVVLGHTSEGDERRRANSRNLREVEAESAALLCLAALDLPGVEFSRGYIRWWGQGNPIPEK